MAVFFKGIYFFDFVCFVFFYGTKDVKKKKKVIMLRMLNKHFKEKKNREQSNENEIQYHFILIKIYIKHSERLLRKEKLNKLCVFFKIFLVFYINYY